MRTDVHGLYANITNEFCDELATKLSGKRVLEVFGGNGFLANELASRGVDIKSTSILSSIDGHDVKSYFNVENIDAVRSVLRYGESYDVLMMSFPIVSTEALKSVIAWGEGKDVVYIGERSSKEMHERGLMAGCASDSLHYSLEQIAKFDSYRPKSLVDTAIIGKFCLKKAQDFLDLNGGQHYWFN